jgi:hypothetical protein
VSIQSQAHKEGLKKMSHPNNWLKENHTGMQGRFFTLKFKKLTEDTHKRKGALNGKK